MNVPKPVSMTADEFIAWSLRQEGRHELVSGEVVAMASERVAHNRVKMRACFALDDAVRAAGLRCQVFTDGMAVRVDDFTVYEPDASVRCGGPLGDDETQFSDPVILVEVVSPSSGARDKGAKLEDYFRLPSVRHYVILRTETRSAIHHARGGDGAIATTIHSEGALRFDPPGISVALSDVFAEP